MTYETGDSTWEVKGCHYEKLLLHIHLGNRVHLLFSGDILQFPCSYEKLYFLMVCFFPLALSFSYLPSLSSSLAPDCSVYIVRLTPSLFFCIVFSLFCSLSLSLYINLLSPFFYLFLLNFPSLLLYCSLSFNPPPPSLLLTWTVYVLSYSHCTVYVCHFSTSTLDGFLQQSFSFS